MANFPLALLIATPIISPLFIALVSKQNISFDLAGARLFFFFAVLQLFLYHVVPGKYIKGPLRPDGKRILYKANGLQVHLITLAGFIYCSDILSLLRPIPVFKFLPRGLDLFPASIVQRNFTMCILFMNIFSLLFCGALYLKGKKHLPPKTTGNFIRNYFWGIETNPKILGVDVKVFTNCRLGMASWSIILLSFLARHVEEFGALSDAMFVSVLLQVIYVAKFFMWETGYYYTLDMMHDKAGFYICWGCLVWVPSMYTLATHCLVFTFRNIGAFSSSFLLYVGVISLWVNYACDSQRKGFREKDGKCKIWMRKPEYIEATYYLEDGTKRYSKLLCSGYWGIARHFHYMPELMAAFCWCYCGFLGSKNNFLALFYFVYLFVLLLHRSYRDDLRCKKKYGKFWDMYCTKVPYKIMKWVY